MLLLYLRFSSSRTTPYSDLHSTMLLLYRVVEDSKEYLQINLHSTMLLLYPGGTAYFVRRNLNLHSTMLLLYLRAYSYRTTDLRFTFHYASTLSSSASTWMTDGYRIYIPLCFYFIPRPDSSKIPRCPYLHSTMLLLYHYICDNCGAYLDPFTFHYASTLSRLGWLWGVRSERIYIPLCFYFIKVSLSSGRRKRSIYIPLCFYFIPCPFCGGEAYISNLHSTMLLLYLQSNTYRLATLCHLHSTMLLLYLLR